MSSAETMLDIFEPPEGLVGHSAILVAMTATEDFLESAMERFTGLRFKQRLELGVLNAFLLLDGHETQARKTCLPVGRIAGLYEVQPKAARPGTLMHAKLAMLGFSESRTGEPSHLRLAVLTANLAYTSAKQQLELAWVLDLPLNSSSQALEKADIAYAAAFLDGLIRSRYYGPETATGRAKNPVFSRLSKLLDVARGVGEVGRKCRFIHSLDEPLLPQIAKKMHGGFWSNLRSSVTLTQRNFMLCGSGFFEQTNKRGGKPTVLAQLEKIGDFTAEPRRVVVVDPSMAGALAPWAKAGKNDSWELARPSDVLGSKRRLHAKFIYIGYLRDGVASNGCLYIGSGNLSWRGLNSSGGNPNGNVECGIVVTVEDRLDPEELKARLFWDQDEKEITKSEWAEGTAEDVPEVDSFMQASPILAVVIRQDSDRALELFWREDVPTNAKVSLSWPGSPWLSVNPAQRVVTFGISDEPNAVKVRDDSTGQEWVIPLVDGSGRVTWKPARHQSFDDALSALLDFPLRPVEAAADEDDSDERESDFGGAGSAKAESGVKKYALHAAALLIEGVATLQTTAIKPAQFDDWCAHLDRNLEGLFPEDLIQSWREHKINVFQHLREPELRPKDMTERQKTNYLKVLDRVARAWGVE